MKLIGSVLVGEQVGEQVRVRPAIGAAILIQHHAGALRSACCMAKLANIALLDSEPAHPATLCMKNRWGI